MLLRINGAAILCRLTDGLDVWLLPRPGFGVPWCGETGFSWVFVVCEGFLWANRWYVWVFS